MASIADYVDRVRLAICQLTVSEQSGRQVTGTGFAVEPVGRIITCNHVARPGTGNYSIRARFPNGQEFGATVASQDVKKDLAILQLTGRAPSTIALRTPSSVRVGDDIFVAGYPIGVSTLSIFKGCVSAKGSGLLTSITPELLQLAVTAQQGNSGGPVFSVDTGDVLGVVSMKYVPLFAELVKLKQIADTWPTFGGQGVTVQITQGGVDMNKYFAITGRAISQLASTLERVSVGVGWATPIDDVDRNQLG